MSTISIAGLVKRYGRTTAVGGVDLAVASGEVIGLLGPSGCGKTTILKCIAGLEQPTGGEIHIDGRLVASATQSLPPERRDIGMVFQSYALWPHKTVYANVAYPLEVRRFPRGEVRGRVGRALELVGLGHLADRYPSQLSGGQQQRVALARSIVYEPKILLFDEPLSNLDANTRLRVRNDLRRLLRRLGITSVYVTHDHVEAMAICDRVVLMHQGLVAQVGTPPELYANPAGLVVAELIGAGNVLEGHVRRLLGGGQCEVLAGSLAVRCPAPAGAKPDSAVSLVMRRDQLHLERASNPLANCWPVKVVERTTFGSYFEYSALAGEVELVVHTADSDWAVDDQGYLAIESQRVICFLEDGPAEASAAHSNGEI